MKRSEAVKLLADDLKDSYGMDFEVQASFILARCMSLGMLPPLNEQNYHPMDNQSRLDTNEIRWYHSWEEEE